PGCGQVGAHLFGQLQRQALQLCPYRHRQLTELDTLRHRWLVVAALQPGRRWGEVPADLVRRHGPVTATTVRPATTGRLAAVPSTRCPGTSAVAALRLFTPASAIRAPRPASVTRPAGITTTFVVPPGTHVRPFRSASATTAVAGIAG